MPDQQRKLPPSTPPRAADPEQVAKVEQLLGVTSAKGKRRIPHLSEVIEHLVDEWGGTRQLAADFHQVYRNIKTSAQLKARMLECVLRLMQAQAAITGAPEELANLTEEELRAAAMTLLAPFDAQAQAQQTPETAGPAAEHMDPASGARPGCAPAGR